MANKIELGDKVKDQVSGIEGIVIGMTKWLAQCDRAVVQATGAHEGRPYDGFSVDVTQLQVLEKGVMKPTVQVVAIEEKKETIKKGGPRPTPTRSSI